MIDPNEPQVLRPFIAAEALSVPAAALIAKCSRGTIRNWASRYGIGRRIAGGHWRISAIALQMLLENDEAALTRFITGDRQSECVRTHIERLGFGQFYKEKHP